MATIDTDYSDAGELVEIVDGGTALEALNRSEIDIQISTAKRFPRSITNFKREAEEMACLDEDTAASMFYVLPRGGKKIEGPSVRLAEVVGCCWGNLRYGSRVVSTDDRFLTAQGVCFDLEKNISASVEVKRRITNKKGERFNDDMIQTTANAACAIALRQAIFKVVPFMFVKAIYEKSKLTSVGKAESMAGKRAKMLDWFKKAGADEGLILGFLGHKGADDISVDDLITLRGVATAIKDGEVTIEAAFAKEETCGARATKVDLPTGKTNAARETEGNGGTKDASPTSEAVDEPAPDDANQAVPDADALEPLRRELLECQGLPRLNGVADRWIGPDSQLSEADLETASDLIEARRREVQARATAKSTTGAQATFA